MTKELSSRHFANFWWTVIIGRSSNQQFQFLYPQFEAWLANQKKQIAQANAAAEAARKKLSSQTGAGQVENP